MADAGGGASVGPSDHLPAAHDRQALDVEYDESAVADLGRDGVRRDHRYPSPAITACLMVSLLDISMPPGARMPRCWNSSSKTWRCPSRAHG